MAARRGRGEGQVEELPSGAWRATLSLGYGAKGKRDRLRKTLRTKGEALAWLRARQADLHAGTLADPRGLTAAAWLDQWLALKSPAVEPRTADGYGSVVRVHLKPALGQLRLAALSPLHVAALYQQLEKGGHSADLRRKCGQVLKAALRDAVRLRVLGSNPAAEVPRPKKVRADVRPLDPDQVLVLLDAADGDRLGPLYRLALDSGMRQGELLALTPADLDFERATVRVVKSLEEKNGALRVKDVKTPHSRRTLRVLPATAEAVRLHLGGRRSGPVFAAAGGGWLSRSNFYARHWQTLREAAGLPHARFHDLRHTCATLLLLANVNLKAVSMRLGHGSVVITLDTYGHLLPAMDDAVLGALAPHLGFGGSPTPAPRGDPGA